MLKDLTRRFLTDFKLKETPTTMETALLFNFPFMNFPHDVPYRIKYIYTGINLATWRIMVKITDSNIS